MPRMPARPGTRTLLHALGRRLPRTRGALRVAGLGAEVVVDRDRWGIPHIEAADDADAWFALGFCHGQDRSFQLELIARAGRGRLAELLGPGALPIDRLSRTLGFRRLRWPRCRRSTPTSSPRSPRTSPASTPRGRARRGRTSSCCSGPSRVPGRSRTCWRSTASSRSRSAAAGTATWRGSRSSTPMAPRRWRPSSRPTPRGSRP